VAVQCQPAAALSLPITGCWSYVAPTSFTTITWPRPVLRRLFTPQNLVLRTGAAGKSVRLPAARRSTVTTQYSPVATHQFDSQCSLLSSVLTPAYPLASRPSALIAVALQNMCNGH